MLDNAEAVESIEDMLVEKDIDNLVTISETAKVQDVFGPNKWYIAAKNKLRQLKETELAVVIVTREEGRGIDIQFADGTLPSHVIIACPMLTSAELT